MATLLASTSHLAPALLLPATAHAAAAAADLDRALAQSPADLGAAAEAVGARFLVVSGLLDFGAISSLPRIHVCIYVSIYIHAYILCVCVYFVCVYIYIYKICVVTMHVVCMLVPACL